MTAKEDTPDASERPSDAEVDVALEDSQSTALEHR